MVAPREGIVREFGTGMYTLLYSKWITTRTYWIAHGTLYYVAAWVGGGVGEEWIPVDVWLSPFAVHLKRSQHCQLAILQHKIKCLKRKKKKLSSSPHGIEVS